VYQALAELIRTNQNPEQTENLLSAYRQHVSESQLGTQFAKAVRRT